MDWWTLLFDADRLLPVAAGLLATVAWFILALQATGPDTVAVGPVTVAPLWLGLSCACLALAAFLAGRTLGVDDPEKPRP